MPVKKPKSPAVPQKVIQKPVGRESKKSDKKAAKECLKKMPEIRNETPVV